MFGNISLLCFSQHITHQNYSYQASDSLVKEEVLYKEPGLAGSSIEWDFSNLTSVNNEYILSFSQDEEDPSIICGKEHRTRYYYQVSEKNILSTGFENSLSKIRYHTPLLVISFPFAYQDTISAVFEGTGEYGDKVTQTIKGKVSLQADAKGTLQLPRESVEALRVKSTRQYTETGKTNLAVVKETYSWYSKEHRYPIFESIKTTYKGIDGKDSIAFYTSFYYSSSMQKKRKMETGEETVAEPIEENNEFITGVSFYPNPVREDLTVSFTLQESEEAKICLYNATGSLVLETKQTFLKGTNNTAVSMGHLSSGSYTLHLSGEHIDLSSVIVKL